MRQRLANLIGTHIRPLAGEIIINVRHQQGSVSGAVSAGHRQQGSVSGAVSAGQRQQGSVSGAASAASEPLAMLRSWGKRTTGNA